MALLLSPHPACGGNVWMPVVHSFDRTDTGRLYSTWRISSKGQWTYFANERGLVEYDGSQWHLYSLNNCSSVRGVMMQPSQRRIYVGGENEFGYFEVNDNGSLHYNCLSDRLPASVRSEMGNVFDFYEVGESVYARCDFMVVIISGDNMYTVKTDAKIYASALWNNSLYLATDSGLRVLYGGRVIDAVGAGTLVGKHINGLVVYAGRLLVATSTEGLFCYNGSTTSRFATAMDSMLGNDILSCAATDGRHLALGTVSSGLLWQDMQTGEVKRFNSDSGCQSNKVQSVAFDEHGNIWIGHDFGLDYVYMNQPFSILYMNFKYGMGNTSIVSDGRFYFGTNQGLYCLPYPVVYTDNQIKPVTINGLRGTAWYLYKHGSGDLLLMHGKGMYVIEGTVARRVATRIEGVWACASVKGRADMLFVGAYQGVYLVRREPSGTWRSLGRIKGISEPCRYFEQDGNKLRVYDMRQERVTVYTLDSTLLNVTGKKIMHGKYTLGGVIDEEAEEWNVPAPPYNIDGNNMVIPFNRGFMLFNRRKTDMLAPHVSISGLWSVDPDSAFYLRNFCGYRPGIVMDSRHSTVRIEYGHTEMKPQMAVKYQYSIDGGEWSSPSDVRQAVFGSLGCGNHVFKVRAVRNGKVFSIDTIAFRILPPWYLTWWAYTLYFLLVSSFAGVIVFSERRRRAMAGRLTEKTREADKARATIVTLRHEQMEQELRHKSQEIANLTINMTRKNEILISMKKDIRAVLARLREDTVVECRRNLLLLTGKIDANIADDAILQRFEEQFDLAYNNFMTRLQRLHPTLGPRERLLCAYMKMNLTTKEIAALMNISVRGVESMRYRMRKKLEIDADANIVAYLNNIGVDDDAP